LYEGSGGGGLDSFNDLKGGKGGGIVYIEV